MIYLDHNATTPVLPEVFDAMKPYFLTDWGNPSSAYRFASKLRAKINIAREQVANLIGALPEEVTFTSCATESNNAALHAALKANPEKRHIVTSVVEHSSVLNHCAALEKDGYRVTYLPVNQDGLLSMADLERAITANTAVVSLMWANNETGVIFPFRKSPNCAMTEASCSTAMRSRLSARSRSVCNNHPCIIWRCPATSSMGQKALERFTSTNLNLAIGMDYDPATTNVIVSVYNGFPVNTPSPFSAAFVRLGTNNAGELTLTNWSNISLSQVSDEIKLAVVKQTVGGFTNGDMFYGTGQDGIVGWLSADGARSNLTWSVLSTNGDNQTHLRGGLCVDQTGVWSNQLIIVTGDGSFGGGVWRINSLGEGLQVANITNTHLEGVTILPNDPARWGSQAGKIITGAESATPPSIFTIGTNGIVTTFVLGIQPEDFDIIPAGQDLYGADESQQRILKVSRNLLTNYVGDLLITQSGDGFPNGPGVLFIVGWNESAQNFFIKSRFSTPNQSRFEHVTFAPVSLPSFPE